MFFLTGVRSTGQRQLPIAEAIGVRGAAFGWDGWADVGHGTLDWKGLMAALRGKTPARYFVMEHDNPSDYERFARRSIAAANAF